MAIRLHERNSHQLNKDLQRVGRILTMTREQQNATEVTHGKGKRNGKNAQIRSCVYVSCVYVLREHTHTEMTQGHHL